MISNSHNNNICRIFQTKEENKSTKYVHTYTELMREIIIPIDVEVVGVVGVVGGVVVGD